METGMPGIILEDAGRDKWVSVLTDNEVFVMLAIEFRYASLRNWQCLWIYD